MYLTSGEKCGFPGLTEDKVAHMREEVAKWSAKIIGISNLVFLRQKDGELRCSSQVVSSLVGVLQNFKQDIVFLPSFFERHLDHFETNRILMSAHSQIRPPIDFQVCAYEVWTALIPNYVVDIEPFAKVKALALEQHKIGFVKFDYSRAILGLNMYRSLFTSLGHGYAEGYLICPAKKYFSLLSMHLKAKKP